MPLAHRIATIMLVGLGALDPLAQTAPRGGSLARFRSDEELAQVVRTIAEGKRRKLEAERRANDAARSCIESIATARESTAGRDAVIRGSLRWRGGPLITDGTVRIADMAFRARSDSAGNYRIVIPAENLTSPRDVAVIATRIGAAAYRLELRNLLPGDSVHIDFALCELIAYLNPATVLGNPRIPEVENRRQDRADEGDFAKVRGDHLIVLRRGRLFTLGVEQGRLRHISTIDASPPGTDPNHGSHDAILTVADKVIVVGESRVRGGVEITVFRIDDQGRLHYGSTYQIRSEGYETVPGNYVPRLVGDKLVFYSYFEIGPEHVDPLRLLPAMRKWQPGADSGGFKRIISATRVYRAPPTDGGDGLGLSIVTTCDVTLPEMECDAYGVLAPLGRVFSVSPRALYIWNGAWYSRGGSPEPSIVYRLPLDGSDPGALNVFGIPTDASSFYETDGYINVLLRDQPPARTAHVRGVSLLRVALRDFGDGTTSAPPSAYRSLPTPSTAYTHLTNRFIGDYVLYGTGSSDRGPPDSSQSTLFIVPWRGGEISSVPFPHGIDQVAQVGTSGLVVGPDGDDQALSFIHLGRQPRLEKPIRLVDEGRGAATYDVTSMPDAAGGVIGLSNGLKPWSSQNQPESASVAYVRHDGRQLVDVGRLSASLGEIRVEDQCKTGCWRDRFNGARAIFHRGRIFALLGYELVEGVIEAGHIREIGRLSFAP